MKPSMLSSAAVLSTAMLLTACATAPVTPTARRDDVADAQSRVASAVSVVNQIKADPAITPLLQRAKGILVIPDYGKAAWIIGGQGGVGVLMAHDAGRWSDPAFFTVGGLSIGLQAGGEAGSMAYLLLTDKAVQAFATHTNKFSLAADAGLTVIKYSDDARIAATTPPADVVVWSGTKGLFGGISIGATDVLQNKDLDEAYYHGFVNTGQILAGRVHNPAAHPLQEALATRVASE